MSMPDSSNSDSKATKEDLALVEIQKAIRYSSFCMNRKILKDSLALKRIIQRKLDSRISSSKTQRVETVETVVV